MKNKKVLVTGGAGYIGSFTVRELLKQNFSVIVVDNLEYGHPQSIPKNNNCRLIKADISDQVVLEEIFKKEKPAAIIHFAGYIVVSESAKNPSKYFENNIVKSKILLDGAVKYKINYFIFSSSAAVYGQPKRIPILETDPTLPNNPYGETKLVFEKMLHWYGQAYGLKSICLRYFNAAGASLDGRFGEDHHPETHLIPRACLAALRVIDDFQLTCPQCKTQDSSTIRDYIHVLDLAAAHVEVLNFLFEKKKSDIFNVGISEGYSTLRVIKEIEKVAGYQFKLKKGPARPGEPEVLVANNQKIKKILGWQAKYSDLTMIVRTAWQWHKGHPRGYK